MQIYSILSPLQSNNDHLQRNVEPIQKLNICDIWRIKDESMVKRVTDLGDYFQIFHNGKPYMISQQAFKGLIHTPQDRTDAPPVKDEQTPQNRSIKAKKKRKKHDKRHVWSKEENDLFEEAIRQLHQSGKRPKPKSIKDKMNTLGYSWGREFPN